MHPQTKDEDVSQKQVTIPDWVKPTVFEELLKRIVKDYKATKSMRANEGYNKIIRIRRYYNGLNYYN